LVVKILVLIILPELILQKLEYFIKQNLICISDVDTRALVSYIRDNGAMNAVICTDGTSVDELKASLANVPDMKGLELASNPLRNLITMVMKMPLIRFQLWI
jgi:carbamoylphosphate synthase small subunit